LSPSSLGATAPHAVPRATLRHSARRAFELPAHRLGRGRGRALEAILRRLVGRLRRIICMDRRHFIRDVDLVAFAAFRANAARHEGGGGRAFPRRHQSLVGHGWPYSPPSAASRAGAAAVFNQNNPWWVVMPDITRYLQRISFLLRQGRPVNDVAIYVPTDDAWASFRRGKSRLTRP